MSNQATPVLVLGAGPAGLGAAIALGENALVLEKSPQVGGQSASVQIGEAVFDVGGHSFHTPHPFVRDLVFDALDMYEQTRQATCYFRGELIPYPFQKNFRLLSDQEVVRQCAAGLKLANSAAAPRHFEEFLIDRFGPGISHHFMIPYNRKLWARELTVLDANWVGERVAAPEGVTEKFEQQGGQRRPLQSDTKVAYPAQGGFGEIYKALARRVQNLKLDVAVTGIDLTDRTVRTARGETFSYSTLVSTLPVHELLRLATPVPEKLLEEVGRLQAMSLKCALVAVNHPVTTDIQRVYCPHEDVPAHKIAVNHNSSDWLRSRKHHGIIGEISYSEAKPVDDRVVLREFIAALIRIGLIEGEHEILDARLIDVRYAYPVPTHDRTAVIDRVKSFLRTCDVYTVGRFAEWAYINSDEALSRGLILGQSLRE